jgi:hypothetical protein
MAYGAAVTMAGKLLPYLTKIATNPLAASIATGTAVGGLPSLLQGNIPSAIGGGIAGGLGGASFGGLGRLAPSAQRMAASALGNKGMLATLGANVAGAAVPVGAGLLGNAILGRGVGNLGNQAMGELGGGFNNAAGIIGYNAVSGEPIVGAAVPGGMGQFGGIPPYGGSAMDVLTPGGPAGAQRLTTLKNAQTMADALNAYLPTVRKFSEQAKKDDFERNMAAAGIRQNILTNAQMLQAAQAAGLGMGLTGAQQAGQALTNQYSYS